MGPRRALSMSATGAKAQRCSPIAPSPTGAGTEGSEDFQSPGPLISE